MRAAITLPFALISVIPLAACESDLSREEIIERQRLLESVEDREGTSNRDRRLRTRGNASGGGDR